MPHTHRQTIPFGGKALGVIPARRASTRFPDKPLALIKGVPMICWTLKRATKAKFVSDAFVVAEDPEIVEAVESCAGRAELVRGDFTCGSERVAAFTLKSNAPAIINIQADVPLLDPDIIDEALILLESHPEFDVTTAVTPISNIDSYRNPNCVKVVLDANYRCLYFSRSPIPALHRPEAESQLPASTPFYRHIGFYCFRRDALERFAASPPFPLEECEGLEQLRILETGGRIGAVVATEVGPGVDSPDDLRQVEEYIAKKKIAFSEAL